MKVLRLTTGADQSIISFSLYNRIFDSVVESGALVRSHVGTDDVQEAAVCC